MRESQVFMLDFLFERNEQDEILNIYNYPRGRGATQIIILLAVNCNKFYAKNKNCNTYLLINLPN